MDTWKRAAFWKKVGGSNFPGGKLMTQSVHALRILRTHGMTAASVHIIFNSVVVAKLVYAASSWWGFATADDRQRQQVVIRRGIRSGFCQQHHKTVEELVEGGWVTINCSPM